MPCLAWFLLTFMSELCLMILHEYLKILSYFSNSNICFVALMWLHLSEFLVASKVTININLDTVVMITRLISGQVFKVGRKMLE